MITLNDIHEYDDCQRLFYFNVHDPIEPKKTHSFTKKYQPFVEYVLSSNEFDARLRNQNIVDLEHHRYDMQEHIKQTMKWIDSKNTVVIKYGYVHDQNEDENLRITCAFEALEINGTEAKLHLVFQKRATDLDELKPEISFAFQIINQVLKSKKISLNTLYIYLANGTYQKQGHLKFQDFVEIKECYQEISALNPMDFTPIKQVIQSNTAPAPINSKKHCPQCPYLKSCWPNQLPEFVSQFYRISQTNYDKIYQAIESNPKSAQAKNIEDFFDLIPDQLFTKNPNHLIQKNAIVLGSPYQNTAQIKSLINTLQYPLSFLDFETIRPAVPLFDNFVFNQQFPFQYALDIVECEEDLRDKSKIKHHEFIGNGIDNPCLDFIQALLSNLPSSGSILVYHLSAERGFLNNLSKRYGYENEINAIINRLVDLKDLLIKNNEINYYHKDFKGGFGLKEIVEPLLGESPYANLAIQDGLRASKLYGEIAKMKDQIQIKQTIENLLAYCNLDARVMIDILNFFRAL